MIEVIYRERVLPSVLTFLLGPVLGLGLFAVFIAVDEQIAVVLALGGALALDFILYTKAPILELSDTTFKVRNATIERKYLGAATAIDKEQAFSQRGVELHARAFTSFQAGVRDLVRVENIDPNDPAPYWLISTRNAERLAELLNQEA